MSVPTPTIRRLSHPAVFPFEACRLELGEQVLGDYVEHRALGDFLLEAANRLRLGTATLRGVTEQHLHHCRDFDELCLCGGRVRQVDLAVLRAKAAYPVTCSGLEDVARILEHKDGMVIDAGQTAVKVFDGSKNFVFPRDFQQLPVAYCLPPEKQAEFAEPLMNYLAVCIGRSCRESGRKRLATAVVAIPCEIDERLGIGDCSYPGIGSDLSFLSESFARSGVAAEEILVLNDAELAAMTVLAGRADIQRMLIFTLGFGIGGAVIDRRG